MIPGQLIPGHPFNPEIAKPGDTDPHKLHLPIGVLTVAVAWLNWRFRSLCIVLEGEPIILVEHGNIIQRNLDRNRITRVELAAAARQQQVGQIEEIQWAVLETNGQISIIPAQES